MGSFFTCKSCGSNLYLRQQKDELTFPKILMCSICRKSNSYQSYEVQQERYDFSCPVCNGRFFIRRTPPLQVRCPHSNSLLYVNSDGSISVLQIGKPPTTTKGGTGGGALGGLLLGALLGGPAGALLGALAGAALGSSADVKEGRYMNDTV